MNNDLYVILGVERGASKEEIDKAYRQLALRYHPDRNPDNDESAEKFKKIAAAYEVLGDQSKKQQYDRFGQVGGNGNGNGRPFNSSMDDFFSHVFGGHNPFRQQQQQQHRGRNIQVEYEVTLEQVLNGDEVEVVYKKRSLCPDCKGSGGEKSKCPECDGQGIRVIRGANMNVRAPCNMCEGTGKKLSKPCEKCDHGFVGPNEHNVKFQIHKGVEEGMRFRCAGQGEPMADGQPGDLFIIVKVKPHKLFTRLKNGNILCKIPVTYTQLVLGDIIEVSGLENKINLEMPAGTASHNKFKLDGQGLPVFSNGRRIYKRGDQLVQVELKVPTELEGAYKEVIEQLAELEKGGGKDGGLA